MLSSAALLPFAGRAIGQDGSGSFRGGGAAPRNVRVSRDQEAPGLRRPLWSRSFDSDTGGDRHLFLRRQCPRKNAHAAVAQVRAVVAKVHAERFREKPRAPGVSVDVGDRFQGSDQNAVGFTAAGGDGIEHVVDAVGDVDQGAAGRAEQGADARGLAAMAVAGPVFEAPIRLGLNDAATARRIAVGADPDLAAEKIPGDIDRVAVIEADGERRGCWLGHWWGDRTFRIDE